MEWLSTIMSVLGGLLSVYIVLLFIRIILTWVSMDSAHPAVNLLSRVTDPYLNWFRRFRFLKFNQIDFSSMVAILFVYFVFQLTVLIRINGKFTLGTILGILVQLLWSAIGFFLIVFAALALVRVLSIYFRWNGQLIWNIFDSILQGIAARVGKLVSKRQFVPYPRALLILFLSCAILYAAGTVGVLFAVAALNALPI